MSRASRRRCQAAVAAVLVALSMTGCSGGEEGAAPRAEPSESLIEPSDAPTLRVEPVTTSGDIVGRLPRSERRRVERAVSRVAVGWLDAAYLGGKYPRRSFRAAFPGFTRGARAAARSDARLMSNKALGRRISAVTPTSVRVRVDLLAVDKRAVSGTAHVDARFRTEGRVERSYRIAGRLMMTRHDRRWQVFGYDVSRSRIGGSGPAEREKQQGTKERKKKDRKKKGDRS